MMQVLVKTIVTAILVAVISVTAKHSTLIGGILASIPLVSVIAIIWLYGETRDVEGVAKLSGSVFWLVIPSLLFFLLLPLLLRANAGFPLAMVLAAAATVAGYFVMVRVLALAGIAL
ncbi:DUF3147 family protein [bacterium]|nr:DUF3147 family protein [bacterium]